MCGIAGILNFNDKPVTKSSIQGILDRIAHRGRDASRVEIGSKYLRNPDKSISQSVEIGLGHNRLSILDLDQSGSQPMFYANNMLCITYNGEIYNYLELRKILEDKSYFFKTKTDTEVLLAAYDYWGKSCVDHLNGMYAFAIWDDKKKQLFCARDPIGIKPFYYKLTSAYFAFASESQALVHLDEFSLHYPSVVSYFLSMYVPSEKSIFAGIEKLLPGHIMTIMPDGKSTIKKFWSIQKFEGLTDNDAHLNNLTELIHQAVTRQLKSDVPVGGFLSGGIDSGLITAIAAPQIKKYYTYSVGYEGLISNELPYARHIAERYQTEHREIIITAELALQMLNKALANMSEPVADPAMAATYILSEMAALDGVKVLLNGTGGDEVFSGYTRYTGDLSLKRKLMNYVPTLMKKLLCLLPVNHKLKSRLKYPELDMLYSTGGSYQLAKEIGDSTHFTFLIASLAKAFQTSHVIPSLYQHMLFDIQVYLPDQLLFLLDQMTMTHTIEGRVPLLDLDLIQFSFNFNAKHHIQNGKTKTLLKKVSEPFLGAEHINRKKQGFAGSSDWWVKQKFNEFIDVIANIRNIPCFEKLNIDKIIKNKMTNDIFLLYCFCTWYDRIQTTAR